MAESVEQLSGQPHQQRQRYFCHQCNLETTPILPDLVCSQCSSGFIEELNTGGTAPQVTTSSPVDFLSQLFGMIPGQNLPQPSDPDRDTDESEMPPGASASAISRHRQQAAWRNGPLRISLDYREAPGSSTNQTGQFVDPLSLLLRQLLPGIGGAGILPLRNLQMHGNPGDYVWGPGGLDTIITQLLNNMESSGPPPADQARIDKLPSTKITAIQVETSSQCSVCFEYFTLDEEVKILPCQHLFHEDCILPWLQIHGTCPVCRKDLNGDDTSTQEYNTNIGETLNSIVPQQETGDGPEEPQHPTFRQARSNIRHPRTRNFVPPTDDADDDDDLE